MACASANGGGGYRNGASGVACAKKEAGRWSCYPQRYGNASGCNEGVLCPPEPDNGKKCKDKKSEKKCWKKKVKGKCDKKKIRKKKCRKTCGTCVG